MAVTRKGNTIRMTAQGDAVTGKICVMDVTLDHSAAANLSFGDSADFIHDRLQTTAEELSKHHTYPNGLIMDGVKAVVLSAGAVMIHIK